MDIPSILKRVEQRLDKIGLSPSAASKLAGKPDAIRNLQRAARDDRPRGLNVSTLSALAPALQTNLSWLVEGLGDEEVSFERTVPVVGLVSAGSAVSFRFADGEFDRVAAPDHATDSTVAVEIQGESLGSFFDHWLVFYDDVHRPITPSLIGKLCVVGLPDGRVLIKKVARSRTLEGHYNLLSQFEEPIYDVEIEWAAIVNSMRPN